MICMILLFLSLMSYEMSEDYNKSLDCEAEENSGVTVEWQFASKVGITISSLKIHCLQLPELKVFFNMDNSFDEPQHVQFAGRVWCDKDALTMGRVRLHLSRARTDDSGRYLCRMATEFGKKVKEFRLIITAATDRPKPVTPTPKPERRGRSHLFAGLALGAAVMAAFMILILHHINRSFIVNVTQSSYQAEENHNITLEWKFTTKPDRLCRYIYIIMSR